MLFINTGYVLADLRAVHISKKIGYQDRLLCASILYARWNKMITDMLKKLYLRKRKICIEGYKGEMIFWIF